MRKLLKTAILATSLVGTLFVIGTADAANTRFSYLKYKYHTTSIRLALMRDRQAKALNPQPLPPCDKCGLAQLNPQPLPPLEINRGF